MNKHLTLGLILAVASQVNAMETNQPHEVSCHKSQTTSPLLSRAETAEEIGIRYINLERLCAAISQQNIPEVKKNLALVADVNSTLPDTKNTPLHVAYHTPTPNVEIIALLLARGANQTARDRHNQTPMESLVQRWQNRRLAEALEIPYPSLGTINQIINDGANPNTIISAEQSVLTLALEKNAYDVAQLLIKKGTNVTRTYEHGNTALHKLAKIIGVKHDVAGIATAQALLDAGASLEAKNNLGQTPYDIAKSNYFAKSLKKFLKKAQLSKTSNNE